MADTNETIKKRFEEKVHGDDKAKGKPHHPPHDLPPHILKILMDLAEKVGRLQGQMDVLLSRR